MSKSFLNLVTIVLVAVGFVACGSDKQSSPLKESDSELLRLVARNDLQGVKYQILKKGANVNAKDKDGRTALMLIDKNYSKGGSITLEITKFLVGQGADVNAKDEDGKTALMLWDREGGLDLLAYDLEMIKFLIEKGADLNVKDKNGWTALMYYANSGAAIDKIKFLVEKGADVNAKTKDGWTALMFATSSNDIVKLLLEKGADVNAKNKDGKTAVDIADELGREYSRDILLKAMGIGE